MIIIELFFVQNYIDAISNIKVLYFHYMLGNKAFSKAKVCQIICKQLFYRFTRKNIAKLYLFQAILHVAVELCKTNWTYLSCVSYYGEELLSI